MVPFLSLLLAAMAPAAADLPMPGCDEAFRARFDPGPLEPGPLRLTGVACLTFSSSSFGVSHGIFSPDGTAVASWHRGAPAPVEIVSPGRPGRVAVPNLVTFRNFAGILGDSGGTAPDALAWAQDSRGLFTVRQQIGSPAGWASGGLEPIVIARDGAIRALPELRHPNGPLDAILWVGGDGRALAQFGTMGGYYRPEHADPAPTLAMVDAARSRVLDAVTPSSLARLSQRVDAWGLRAAGAAATLLPDGRIRAVIQFSRWADRRGRAPGAAPVMQPGFWLVWTQGRPPVEWLRPDDDRALPLAFSPDGRALLTVRPLQPIGIQVFDCRRCPPPPPPEPVSGTVAELIDIASRRVVWQVPARAVQFWSQAMAPAISPDGRYALIELPSDQTRKWLGLIDMRNGRLVQRLAPFQVGSYNYTASFAPDGRLRLNSGNFLLTYSLPGRR